ncbi:hypothetical protein JB92DRAFT_707718 [Gautieria morchelliformis]|nr:hypothetical protein JB92DRAFT_707718 [Gautieria morchelliformis]
MDKFCTECPVITVPIIKSKFRVKSIGTGDAPTRFTKISCFRFKYVCLTASLDFSLDALASRCRSIFCVCARTHICILPSSPKFPFLRVHWHLRNQRSISVSAICSAHGASFLFLWMHFFCTRGASEPLPLLTCTQMRCSSHSSARSRQSSVRSRPRIHMAKRLYSRSRSPLPPRFPLHSPPTMRCAASSTYLLAPGYERGRYVKIRREEIESVDECEGAGDIEVGRGRAVDRGGAGGGVHRGL